MQKYLIIAMYENDETEPSLILQVEKFDYSEWQNTMQIWLEYLGIIGEIQPILGMQIFNEDTRIQENSFVLISTEPSMPAIRVILTGNDFPEDYGVDMRLKIVYNRDGVETNNAPINNVRNDSTFYPANEWQNVALNEEWRVNFGNDIRGGMAYLLCRHDNQIDTSIFYIRGTNPTEAQIRSYINEQGYNQYWFIIKMARRESSMCQFGTLANYTINRQTGNANASGEPLYGPPRGFGLKQLDNWGRPNHHAYSQHLWNWKANIDGGVEVIREKERLVSDVRRISDGIIERWNDMNPDNPVSDSLLIIAGENEGIRVLTITEGNETFSVIPTVNQRDVYDARWIKLFNGPANPYYQVIEPTGTNGVRLKPYRAIHRTNNLSRNYVQDVCNQPN
jgi:hypothetical protein